MSLFFVTTRAGRIFFEGAYDIGGVNSLDKMRGDIDTIGQAGEAELKAMRLRLRALNYNHLELLQGTAVAMVELETWRRTIDERIENIQSQPSIAEQLLGRKNMGRITSREEAATALNTLAIGKSTDRRAPLDRNLIDGGLSGYRFYRLNGEVYELTRGLKQNDGEVLRSLTLEEAVDFFCQTTEMYNDVNPAGGDYASV
jgi:hypothetical protein